MSCKICGAKHDSLDCPVIPFPTRIMAFSLLNREWRAIQIRKEIDRLQAELRLLEGKFDLREPLNLFEKDCFSKLSSFPLPINFFLEKPLSKNKDYKYPSQKNKFKDFPLPGGQISLW